MEFPVEFEANAPDWERRPKPLYPSMRVTVTPLEPHPNDPAAALA